MVSGKKKIGLMSALLFGMALLLPIAPVPVYGVIQPLTQGHMALAYLAAAIPMTFVAYSFGLLGVEFPRAGSSYTFVSEAMNPYLGTVVGWAILLDYGLFPLLNYVVTATFLCEMFPGLNFTACIIGCIIIICIINLLGIKSISIVNNILTIFGFLVVFYFVYCSITTFSDPGSGMKFSSIGLVNPDIFSWPLLLTGASIACFSFLGFDAITTLSEDINNPKKVLPKALILTCVLMCVVFIVMSWLAQCAYPSFEYSNMDVAFIDPAIAVGGKLMGDLILLAMIAGGLAFSLDMMAGVTRLLFGMGRDGVLPKKVFGYVNKKGVPVYNIILVTVFCLCFTNMKLGDLMPMINFGALIAFMMVNLSVIVHFFVRSNIRQGAKNLMKYLIMPGIGFITCFALWISLPMNSKLVGGSWLVAGVIYIAIWSKGFKKKFKLHGEMEPIEEEAPAPEIAPASEDKPAE